jgi:hypothetical protein
LNKGANPQEELKTGRYKIESATKKAAPEVELRDDEIPF